MPKTAATPGTTGTRDASTEPTRDRLEADLKLLRDLARETRLPHGKPVRPRSDNRYLVPKLDS